MDPQVSLGEPDEQLLDLGDAGQDLGQLVGVLQDLLAVVSDVRAALVRRLVDAELLHDPSPCWPTGTACRRS